MIATAPVARAMEKNGSSWSTYAWHRRSVAVAIAIVRYMTTNRRKLMSGVKERSAEFEERLYSSALAGTALSPY